MTQPQVQNGAGGGEVVEAASAVFSALQPQLLVQAPKAIDAVNFYKAAFGAEETARTVQTKRKADQEVPHISAQLLLAGSSIVVADAADLDAVWKFAGTGVALQLETDDVPTAIKKAVEAGAVAQGEISEGEGACVVGRVTDPYGYLWIFSSSPAKEPVAAHVEA